MPFKRFKRPVIVEIKDYCKRLLLINCVCVYIHKIFVINMQLFKYSFLEDVFGLRTGIYVFYETKLQSSIVNILLHFSNKNIG
jgi:hypothetical protein